MATHVPITGAPTRATPLSDFALVCLKNCPDPDMLERIGRIFLDTAAELRRAQPGETVQ